MDEQKENHSVEEKQEELEERVENELISALNRKDKEAVLKLVEDSHPIDLAYALEEASDSDIVFLATILPDQQMAEIIEQADDELQVRIMKLFDLNKIIRIFQHMSKDDIDKAVKEAEQFAAEDKKRKDEVDTHNAADQVIYQTEKTLNELGDKVSESEKAPVQAALEDLKTKNKGNDIEAIKAATDAVQKAFYAISEKLYQQAAPQQGEANNGGAANNGGHDDGVVDADYEEVKD